ncbi:hypothetical protein [Pseudonocardia sp. GCM10023141]|uniref:hypothetical protein n=1 Tax=Pseudonocardia sp. GCM10023141 TaxID=3252653 RepID=UPI003614F7B9
MNLAPHHTVGYGIRESTAAPCTSGREVLDDLVGISHNTQRPALGAGLLTRRGRT